MFYFKLYDDKRLQNLKHSKKVDIVNDAVKLYRKDNPLNLTKAIFSIFIVCFIPSLAFYLFSGTSLAIGWFSLSIFVLNLKSAHDESPKIKPYLEQVIN